MAMAVLAASRSFSRIS